MRIIPRISKSSAGGRSFSYLAPKIWNSLPNIVRDREADTLCQLKARLKTHLIRLQFNVRLHSLDQLEPGTHPVNPYVLGGTS